MTETKSLGQLAVLQSISILMPCLFPKFGNVSNHGFHYKKNFEGFRHRTFWHPRNSAKWRHSATFNIHRHSYDTKNDLGLIHEIRHFFAMTFILSFRHRLKSTRIFVKKSIPLDYRLDHETVERFPLPDGKIRRGFDPGWTEHEACKRQGMTSEGMI